MAEELCKSCQPLEMKLRRELLEPESPEKVKAQEAMACHGHDGWPF
jgi:hypothetical protein